MFVQNSNQCLQGFSNAISADVELRKASAFAKASAYALQATADKTEDTTADKTEADALGSRGMG